MAKPKAPIALKAVAVIFLLTGILAVDRTLSHTDYPNIDIGVLGIPIFFGLLSDSTGWRTCALALTWLGLIVAPSYAMLVLLISGPVPISLLGVHFGLVSPLGLATIAAAIFLYLLWQYRVLTRPDIRALFYPPKQVGLPQNPPSA